MKEVITYYKEETGYMYIPYKDKKKYNKHRGTEFFEKRSRNTKCECGQFISDYAKKDHIKTHKHKELLDPEKHKNYITCECGEIMTANNYKRHLKVQRHFFNLQKRSLEFENVSSS